MSVATVNNYEVNIEILASASASVSTHRLVQSVNNKHNCL
jgi:hypothetical protein